MKRWSAVLAAAMLGACQSGPDGGVPVIGAVVRGSDSSAAAPGLSGAASLQVLNASTGGPIDGASVKVNSQSLPFRAEDFLYAGPVSVALGAQVTVSVSVGGATYSASGTQLAGTPNI